MCNHANRESAMVIIDPGTPERHGRDGVWCDPCLEPIIRALNEGGVRTVTSCCGHGNGRGSIGLADGRWLLVMDDAQFTINPTTQAAANAVRALIQRREMESAAMILAALGMEES